MKLFRRWRRKSLYKKSLIIFSLVCILLCGTLIVYVYNSLVLYERNLVENYIIYLGSKGELNSPNVDTLFSISPLEKQETKISDGLEKIYKSNDIDIKKDSKLSTDSLYVYDLYNGDNLINKVSLKAKDSYTKMGILKINEWELVNVENYFKDGLYKYEITIPKDYTITINGKNVADDLITSEGDVTGLERLTQFVEIAKTKTYNINNLVYKPEIKIYDENNKEVKYEIDNNKIIISKQFKEGQTLEEVKEYIKDDFDILKVAQNWSLFMSNDTGLNSVTPYLIANTYMYERAYSWSHSIDRTFVSSHRLQNPAFTNTKLSNFIIYNENAFSCEVYLEKNMIVSGKNQIDKMHDRLYFIYYNGGYKLVNMEAVTE